EEWLVKNIDVLKKKLPGVLIEYGSISYFAELNRARLSKNVADAICFPVNPQAHAVDTRTMVDNLGSHTELLETARKTIPGKPVRVGPLSFSQQNNMTQTQFAAWWTMIAIGNFSTADTITIGPVADETSALYKLLQQLKQFKPASVIRAHKHGLASE